MPEETKAPTPGQELHLELAAVQSPQSSGAWRKQLATHGVVVPEGRGDTRYFLIVNGVRQPINSVASGPPRAGYFGDPCGWLLAGWIETTFREQLKQLPSSAGIRFTSPNALLPPSKRFHRWYQEGDRIKVDTYVVSDLLKIMADIGWDALGPGEDDGFRRKYAFVWKGTGTVYVKFMAPTYEEAYRVGKLATILHLRGANPNLPKTNGPDPRLMLSPVEPDPARGPLYREPMHGRPRVKVNWMVCTKDRDLAFDRAAWGNAILTLLSHPDWMAPFILFKEKYLCL